ncbi:uncharacterized protein LOC131213615 [Anopheles bellator]|uniref:uncharacterized protein LOC131213615 n=1 Tax=Anopheles bellator TaxID=139047 RepID=UPI002649AFF8|nr:uncharacterized protein LOC131213615 [Anopheles bellator]XP_058063675.1 uncharacterized protein LOC131213615 [Anopheles bellator]
MVNVQDSPWARGRVSQAQLATESSSGTLQNHQATDKAIELSAQEIFDFDLLESTRKKLLHEHKLEMDETKEDKYHSDRNQPVPAGRSSRTRVQRISTSAIDIRERVHEKKRELALRGKPGHHSALQNSTTGSTDDKRKNILDEPKLTMDGKQVEKNQTGQSRAFTSGSRQMLQQQQQHCLNLPSITFRSCNDVAVRGSNRGARIRTSAIDVRESCHAKMREKELMRMREREREHLRPTMTNQQQQRCSCLLPTVYQSANANAGSGNSRGRRISTSAIDLRESYHAKMREKEFMRMREREHAVQMFSAVSAVSPRLRPTMLSLPYRSSVETNRGARHREIAPMRNKPPSQMPYGRHRHRQQQQQSTGNPIRPRALEQRTYVRRPYMN